MGLLHALQPRPPCGSCDVQHLESYVPQPSQWLGSTVVVTSLVVVVNIVVDVEVEEVDVDDTRDVDVVDGATEVLDDDDDVAARVVVACVGMVEHFIQ